MKMDQFLEETKDGTIFSVKFIKRTDGSERNMLCRRGVQIGLKGVGMPYDPREKGLLTVYDVNKIDPRNDVNVKGAYRNIPLDAIIEVAHHGKIYVWNKDTEEFDEVLR